MKHSLRGSTGLGGITQLTEQRLHVGLAIFAMPDISRTFLVSFVLAIKPIHNKQRITTASARYQRHLQPNTNNNLTSTTKSATMQFTTIVASAFALAAGVSASQPAAYQSTPSYPIGNGTTGAVGTASPSGTGSPSSSTSSANFQPGENAASTLSTGAMGLIVVGGIALVSSIHIQQHILHGC